MRCHRLPHLVYCDALVVETDQLVAMIRKSDLSAPVPTCPPWSVADLLGHLGQIHRWASTMVSQLAHARLAGRDRLWPPPAELPDWIDAGGAGLIAALRAVDPDAPMWAWGADRYARFWSRRMLHETRLHRADVELALGQTPLIDPDVAMDGLDEFFDNLPCAAYFAPGVRRLRGAGERVAWHAVDQGVDWVTTLHPDGFTWSHEDDEELTGPPTVSVRGDAADLYLFAWRRMPADDPRLMIEGDRALLDYWIENTAL